jgi:hypothetical protein
MFYNNLYFIPRGRRGRDRMVVGFTTTCAISSNHHLSCGVHWLSQIETAH